MPKATIHDIITTQWVRDTFMPGVTLLDNDGVPIPEVAYVDALNAAISQTESELSITIDPIEVSAERCDLTNRETQAFWPVRLTRRPLIAVTEYHWQIGTLQAVNALPLEWIDIQNAKRSLLHVMPVRRAMEPAMLIPVELGTMAMFRSDYLPGWWSFTYRAGFRAYTTDVVIPAGQTTATLTFATGETFLTSQYSVNTGLVSPNNADADITVTVTERRVAAADLRLSRAPAHDTTVRLWTMDMPDSLKSLIGIRAAKNPLAFAGDFVLGVGILSRNTSMDGLSQSHTTTKKGRGALGDRLTNLEMREVDLLRAVCATYPMMNIIGI